MRRGFKITKLRPRGPPIAGFVLILAGPLNDSAIQDDPSPTLNQGRCNDRLNPPTDMNPAQGRRTTKSVEVGPPSGLHQPLFASDAVVYVPSNAT